MIIEEELSPYLFKASEIDHQFLIKYSSHSLVLRISVETILVLEGHCYAWQYESFFFFKFIEKAI